MPQNYEWFFTLIFFSAILGIVVSLVLFFLNRNKSVAPRLLAVYILLFSLITLHNGLSFTNFYLSYPHLWRFTPWATFCAPVIAYLYVRSVLTQSFRLKKMDWLLFIPALLHIISFLPYYSSSRENKLQVIRNFMADRTLISKEPEGILPPGWAIAARILIGMALLAAQFVMLARMNKKISAKQNPVQQNLTTFRWLFLFTSILSFFYIVILFSHIGLFNFSIDLSTLIFFSFFGTLLFICLYLLAKPSILYGLQGWLQDPEPSIIENLDIADFEMEADKRPSLSIEQGLAYKTSLEGHFKQNRPFRKLGYKIKDLSEELEIPSYQLSAFINQEYGKNFNELINEYRVLFMAKELKEHPEKFQFTLEALAKEAGFNSRNSFFTAVKKNTGLTPSEYFGAIESVQ